VPKFCANLSLLFNEFDFPDRFDAAARAGFRGVEIQFPYAHDSAMVAERAQAAGVEIALFNLPAGDWEKGDRGIACLPARMSEFRDGVGIAIEYARVTGCRRLNMVSGIAPPRLQERTLRDTFISNLRFAADELARAGIALMMEPINTFTVPGIYLRYSGQALALIDEAGVADKAQVQYDIFHMQIMEGDLARTIEANIARIGHMQVADVPDRHEPGTGEINFPYLFDHIDRLGYSGWIGAEYHPAHGTLAGLAWVRPYLDTLAMRYEHASHAG
jgi:hydroxypyruvate isomerase